MILYDLKENIRIQYTPPLSKGKKIKIGSVHDDGLLMMHVYRPSR